MEGGKILGAMERGDYRSGCSLSLMGATSWIGEGEGKRGSMSSEKVCIQLDCTYKFR